MKSSENIMTANSSCCVVCWQPLLYNCLGFKTCYVWWIIVLAL